MRRTDERFPAHVIIRLVVLAGLLPVLSCAGVRYVDSSMPLSADEKIEEDKLRKELLLHDAPETWLSARERLQHNPKARLLAVNPDVWLVPDVISAGLADDLVTFCRKRHPFRDPEPNWCFHEDYKLSERFPDLNAFPDEDGSDCIADQEKGAEIAADNKRSVSRSWMVSNGEAEVADKIGRTVEDDIGLSLGHAYHTQVLEYAQLEEFTAHEDCSKDTPIGENDRAGTALLYLTDVAEGGETCFGHRDLCVKPRKGAGLFFQSLNAQRVCDPLSNHEAKKVTNGNKIVLQRWYYTQYSVPAGEGDVVLCDRGNNCRHYMHNQSRAEAVRLSKKAQELAQGGDAKKSNKMLKAAVSAYPTYATAAAHYGMALFDKERLDLAEEHLRNALVEAPKWPDVHFLLGQIAGEKERWREAVEHFRIMLATSPDDEEAWFHLASALQYLDGKEVVEEGLRAIERHLAMNPGDPEGAAVQVALNMRLKTQDEL